MKATIEPGYLKGIVTPPSSKSITQRAYAAALLHKGKTIIHHPGKSDDEQAALAIIQQLGATVLAQSAHTIEVISNGLVTPVSPSIYCGESGLAARLFTPIAALSRNAISIEGKGSLLRRPIEGLAEVMEQLNVSLTGFNGYLPFTIQGPIQAKDVTINASGGSQLLSGILFAICHCATEPINIKVLGLKSKPYIDVTLDVLARFGKKITHNNYREFYIDPSVFTHEETVELTVEADWSSAAYMLVAGAIGGEITVNNLNINSTQADRVLLDILTNAGADIIIDGDSVKVSKHRMLAFEFDATHCPDLFPVLAILASCCYGESSIKGVHRLFHKESNRVESVTEMLWDFAVPWSVEDDTLFITGVQRLQGTIIDSFSDHRIVMAATIGAIRAKGPVEITFAESVNKSYPDFFTDIVLCGGKTKLN